MTTLSNLKNSFPRTGTIEWIGLRQKNKIEILSVKTAELLINHGLIGDKAGQKVGSKRQVSLIQFEYLDVIASLLNKKLITAELLRRNLVISGINLAILKGCIVQINQAIIEITGNCAPCTKMEQALGPGGFNAMRNHGGMTAIVHQGGVINVGDEVLVSSKEEQQQRLL